MCVNCLGVDTVPIQHTLRVEFSGEKPIGTDYLLKIDDPTSENPAIFSELKNYSETPNSSGIFHFDDLKKHLLIEGNQGLITGAFTVKVSESDEVSFSLLRKVVSDSGEPEWKTIQSFQLQNLVEQERIRFEDKGESVNQVWDFQRLKPAQILLENWQELSVFDAGQTITANLTLPVMPANLAEPYIAIEIRRVEDSKLFFDEVFEINPSGGHSIGRVRIELSAPTDPGVYEANIKVVDRAGKIWSRFKKPMDSALKIQRAFIVTRSATEIEKTWNITQSIVPSPLFWLTPDWLNYSKVNLPIGFQLELPISNQIKWAEHKGESVSVLPPESYFETDLDDSDGSAQLHSIRVPSNIQSEFEILIGNEEGFPNRRFRLTPDPNAELLSPWQTLSWTHHSRWKEHIKILNPNISENVAFESILVESRKTSLSPTNSNDSEHRHVVLRLNHWDWIDELSCDYLAIIDESKWNPKTIELYRLHLAIKRLMEWSTHNGFNAILLAANRDHQTLYRSRFFSHGYEQHAHKEHYLDLILSAFDKTGLGMMVEIRPDIHFPIIDAVIADEREIVSDNPIFSSGQNLDLDHIPSSSHPFTSTTGSPLIATATTMRQCLAELAKVTDDHPSFSGMVINLDGDLNGFAMFRKSASLKNGNENISDLENKTDSVTSSTEQQSSPLTSWENAWKWMLEPIQSTPTFFIESDEDQADQGTSPFVFIDQRQYSHADNLSKRLSLRESNSSHTSAKAVLFRDTGERSDQPRTSIRPLDISRTIEKQQPDWIMVDENLASQQFSASLIQNLESFSVLPTQPLNEIEPIGISSATARIWSYRSNDYLHLFVVNLVPWATDIDIETLEPMTWELLDTWNPSSSNQSTVTTIRPTRSRLTLSPGRCVTLKSKTAGRNSVRQWSSRVSGGPEVVKRIKQRITGIVENAGRLHHPNHNPKYLSNGSFERKADTGVVGWLHAQHPAGCVSVDPTVSNEGSQSIRLVTESDTASRTWLMSETFSPPATGRLAVSLSLRGIPAQDSKAPQEVRIAIETSIADKPHRVLKSLTVPDDGKWSSHEIVLEVDGVHPDTHGLMRIAIDSLKPGTIWIDDVRIYDVFPLERERSEFQRKIFLAVQGMQRGNLLPAGELLNDFWIRDLRSDQMGNGGEIKAKMQAVESNDPSVAERIKGWIPESLRF